MNARWKLVAVALLSVAADAFAQGAPPVSSSATVSDADILESISTAGVLPTADTDVPAHAFIAQNEEGGFPFRALRDGCWDLGAGSNDEICTVDGQIRIGGSSVTLPTTQIAQGANPTNATMRWYADAAQFFGVLPTTDTTGCAAGKEGGIRALSSDHTLRYCDGTTLQRVGFILTNSGVLDFPSLNNNEDASLTMTVTGAATGEAVACNPTGPIETGLQVSYSYVSGTNTVTVVIHDASGGTVDPAAATYRCVVLR